jgi:lipid-binding SYLF domain-containing protein
MLTVPLLAASLALALTPIADRSGRRAEDTSATARVDRVSQKRQAVDEMAGMTMDRLLAQSPQAQRLLDKSIGYAVFDNFKLALLVSGGGGIGVAVERSSRERTYMKMGTAGIGLGLGGQSYSVVFLFEDAETFRSFVDRGWHADATATAALWTKGASADASFSHGLAVYQLTNKGLMAHLDISGTKYWKHKKLNAPVQRAQLSPPAPPPPSNRPRVR